MQPIRTWLLVLLAAGLAWPGGARAAPGFVEKQVVVADKPAYYELFGREVALQGDVLAVRAGRDDPGTVYLLRRSDRGAFKPVQRLRAPAGAGEHFGLALAFTGGQLVVAGKRALHIYAERRGKWALSESLTVAEHGTIHSLAADAKVIAATVAQGGGERPGKAGAAPKPRAFVYAWARAGDGWRALSAMEAPPEAAQAAFGSDLAVEGDTLLVGAPNLTVDKAQQGGIYVFRRDGERWYPAERLLSPEPHEADFFGHRLELRGGLLAATNGHGERAAFVFERNPEGTFRCFDKLLPADAPGALPFLSPAVAGPNRVLLTGTGAAFVFDRTGPQDFVQVQTLRARDEGPLNWLGAVSADGRLAAIPAPNRKAGKVELAGAVYLFEADADPAPRPAPGALPDP